MAMSDQITRLIANQAPVYGHRPWPRYHVDHMLWVTIGQAIAGISQTRQDFEDRQTFATAYDMELRERALANGVDTDAEMQRLMLLEQAYAANARVLQVAAELMRMLFQY